MSTLKSLASRRLLTAENKIQTDEPILATPVCEELITAAISNLRNTLYIAYSDYQPNCVEIELEVRPTAYKHAMTQTVYMMLNRTRAHGLGAQLRQLCTVDIPNKQDGEIFFDREDQGLSISFSSSCGLRMAVISYETTITLPLDLDTNIPVLLQIATLLENA